MGNDHPLLERMRRTQAGWKDENVVAVLEHSGYEYQRTANHGAFYRHPEIAQDHPDRGVRMKYAYFCVPRGDVKEYIVRDLIAAIDMLQQWRESKK